MGGGPDKEYMLIALPGNNYDLSNPIAETHRRFPHIEIVVRQDEVPKDLFAKVTILVTFGTLPSTPEDAPNLKIIHFLSAGVDHFITHPLIQDTSIIVTTSSGIHGPPISEWVLMSTLVLSKNYNIMHDQQKIHKWDTKTLGLGRSTDWTQKTVGIAGYGSIGRQIARVFKAMGANVHAYTATARTTPEARADNGYIIPNTGDADGTIPSAWFSGTDTASLHTFLRSGLDLLVISLPLTPSTRHRFSKAEFAILSSPPPDATGGKAKSGSGCIVVNISRGPVVEQPALVEALNDGTLRGAALDVTEPEPLPADDPLWDAKNCIVTPHMSGAGSEYMNRAYDVLLTNLGRWEKGERLFNLVDRGKGY